MSKTKESHVSVPEAELTSYSRELLTKVLNREDGVFKFVLHVLGWYSIQMKCSSIIHILCMLSCRAVYSLKGDAVLPASWLLACRVKDLVVGCSKTPSNSILNCVKLLSIYGLDNLHVYFALLE